MLINKLKEIGLTTILLAVTATANASPPEELPPLEPEPQAYSNPKDNQWKAAPNATPRYDAPAYSVPPPPNPIQYQMINQCNPCSQTIVTQTIYPIARIQQIVPIRQIVYPQPRCFGQRETYIMSDGGTLIKTPAPAAALARGVAKELDTLVHGVGDIISAPFKPTYRYYPPR